MRHKEARRRGIGLVLVIFDPAYPQQLYAARRGPYLTRNLKFFRTEAWVRHDEHYHVDFSVRRKPMEDEAK